MKFKCMDACCKDDLIYYIDETNGLVLRYNLKNTIDYYDYIELKDNTSIRRIIEYNSQYYLVTNTGIVRYDFNKKNHGEYIYNSDNFKYGIKDAVLWEGIIISITGKLKNELICYNIEKNEEYFCDDIIKAMNNNQIQKNMISTIKLIKNKLFFTLIDDKKLYSYELINKKINTECEFDEIISAFDYCDNTFWVRYKDGFQIVEWNKTKDIIKKYSLNDLKEEERTEKHAKVLAANNRVLLLPYKSNTFAFVDFENDCITRINPKTEINHSLNHEKYSFSIGNVIIGSQIVFLPWSTDSTVIIDTNGLSMEVYQPIISQKAYDIDMELRIKRNDLTYESGEQGIISFVQKIINV